MMFVEMSRDETHGGGTWGFLRCVFAPTEKQGGGNWPFWSNILKIHSGDLILHLRGIPPKAEFIGYSVASGDGFETSQRPPDPRAWSYSRRFFRADLRDFVPFHQPINLNTVFDARREELEKYFYTNKSRQDSKLNLFYVRQAGRLQCLNGAYLSEVDDELLTALFGDSWALDQIDQTMVRPSTFTVQTASQLRQMRARLGQSRFSNEIKRLFGYRCCFPDCGIEDPRFLVGAHIARWADNDRLRGDLRNGLCFCLIHDRAFELGLFTLDENYRVFSRPEGGGSQSVQAGIIAQHGNRIRTAGVLPLHDALLEHWVRVDIDPMSGS